MTTYVLVHGAWHGGWCWDRVAGLLRDAGHEVLAPTLTAADPEVGLRTHAGEVAALLRQYDLRDVVLVGHSYGGLVIREAADRDPDRVAELVMLDAWVAADGRSLDDVAPERFAGWVARHTADGFIAVPPPAMVGVTDPDQVAALVPRLVPQPRRTFAEPTRLTGAVDDIACRTIVCVPDNGMPFSAWARERGWPVAELATGHDAMVTMPERTTELLLG